MNTNTISLILLMISSIAIIVLFSAISKNNSNSKQKNQLKRFFLLDLFNILIILIGQILQLAYAEKYNISPIYFDYFVYIGTIYLPVTFLFTGLSFNNVKFSKKYLLLCIIPTISLITLWTNDYHHLFYKYYSTSVSEAVYGPFLSVHNIYSYLLLTISFLIMLKNSVANGGLFSKQSILLLLGVAAPVSINILGTLKIIPMTIYWTPITFTITVAFIAVAIFKFNFLGVAPIALRKIIDRISDSFIVLNEENLIADYNKTFLNTFKIKDGNKYIGYDIKSFLNKINLYLDYNKIVDYITEINGTNKSKSFELHVKKIDRYFNTEITSIISNGQHLGTLILFKDITQHKKDIATIKDNQSVLMEKERLATLGAMIGGVAHNLKTPIMSIAGATEGLEDLVNEYKNSVGDPEVTVEDHHAIAGDMMDWVKKIRSYDGYMSDIITAVKGQAVNMNDNQDESFTVDELLSRVNILMKHELKEGQVALNEQVSIDNSVKFDGNVNSLVQVVNNLISNAIQSYPPVDPSEALSATGSSFIKGNGADNGSGAAIGQKITNIQTSRTIDLIISSKNDNIQISVVDHGSGMTDEVKNKLFKEMITTKGHNGSGLGLFMSYSTVKGNFHGDMNFTSELGKGTTFNIILPRK